MATSHIDEPLAGPTRPAKLSVEFFTADDDIGFIDRRRGRRWTALFLIVWLTGWSFGCVMLINELINKPELGTLLFGIPFWASWLFVAGMIIYLLFSRTYFALTSQGAFRILRVVVPLSQRYVPLSEVKGFARSSRMAREKNPTLEYGVEMRTVGTPVKLVMGIPRDECDWLCIQLNRQLGTMRGDDPSFDIDEACPIPARPPTTKAGPQREVLRLVDGPLDPPSDCSWELHEGMALEFTQRGRFNPAALGAMLFICLFWNGIVSVFLYALFVEGEPPGIMWWGVFVFLLPFEAVGLVLIFGLLAVLVEPLRRSVWQVADHEILYWLTVTPWRRMWRYEVPTLSRIELRRADKPGRNNHSVQTQSDSELNTYNLVLIARNDNAEVVKLEQLTEGEARWMADVILRQRTGWFR